MPKEFAELFERLKSEIKAEIIAELLGEEGRGEKSPAPLDPADRLERC